MANKQRAAKPAQNDSTLPGTDAGSGTEASTSTSTSLDAGSDAGT